MFSVTLKSSLTINFPSMIKLFPLSTDRYSFFIHNFRFSDMFKKNSSIWFLTSTSKNIIRNLFLLFPCSIGVYYTNPALCFLISVFSINKANFFPYFIFRFSKLLYIILFFQSLLSLSSYIQAHLSYQNPNCLKDLFLLI